MDLQTSNEIAKEQITRMLQEIWTHFETEHRNVFSIQCGVVPAEQTICFCVMDSKSDGSVEEYRVNTPLQMTRKDLYDHINDHTSIKVEPPVLTPDIPEDKIQEMIQNEPTAIPPEVLKKTAEQFKMTPHVDETTWPNVPPKGFE